jgi:hypothetical protein
MLSKTLMTPPTGKEWTRESYSSGEASKFFILVFTGLLDGGGFYVPNTTNSGRTWQEIVTVQAPAEIEEEPRLYNPDEVLSINAGEPAFFRVVDFSELGQSEPSDWLECSVLRTPTQPTGPIPPNGATGVSFLNPLLSVDPCPVARTQTNFTISTSPDFTTDVLTGPSFHNYSTGRPSFYPGDLQTNRTYFVQVDAFNPVGTAPPLVTQFTTANPFPFLHCTGDRPDDQGGFFDAELIASGLDIEPCSGSSTCVDDYYFFALLTPDEIPIWDLSKIKGEFARLPAKVKAAAGEVDSLYIWQPLFGFPAIGKRNYLVSLPTRTDSAAGRRYWQRIVALAMLGNGKYYCSNIDSAYSVDNLAPNPPGGGVASPQGGSVRLAWMPNVEKDFKEYVVYRSTDASANVKDLTPIGTVTNTEFVDQNPPSGTVYYFIVARDKNNNDSPPTMLSAVTGVTSLEGVPTEFSLGQNYPNPFNPSTTIQFGIPEQSSVIIQVINTLGQVVDEIANRELSAGFFQITWDARVPSGLYIYRMVAKPVGSEGKEFVAIRKMVLLR